MQGLKTALTRVRSPVHQVKNSSLIVNSSKRTLSAHNPQQLLQLQSSFLSTQLPRFYSLSQRFFVDNHTPPSSIMVESMAQQQENLEPTDPNVTRILDFWFHEHTPQYWFLPPDPKAFDDKIRSNFGSLVEKARDTTELDHWTSTPQGALALVLLLDQFPRNIYRMPNPDAHLSFASDAKGLATATLAIAHDFDKQIATLPGCNRLHRTFFYVPFMHAEDLLAQVAGVALYEQLAHECDKVNDDLAKEHAVKSVEFSKKHLHCVRTLGRFPKRNEALGREMREVDKKWLEKYPHGF